MSQARKHTPRLVRSRDVHDAVHGAHALGRFNAWLAVRITRTVGTMWCAYVFLGVGVGSLVGVLTGNALLGLICGAVSSYVIQLVLLPVIMVGQNVQQAASDARAEADHQTLTAIHALTSRIDEVQDRQIEILKRLDAK